MRDNIINPVAVSESLKGVLDALLSLQHMEYSFDTIEKANQKTIEQFGTFETAKSNYYNSKIELLKLAENLASLNTIKMVKDDD